MLQTEFAQNAPATLVRVGLTYLQQHPGVGLQFETDGSGRVFPADGAAAEVRQQMLAACPDAKPSEVQVGAAFVSVAAQASCNHRHVTHCPRGENGHSYRIDPMVG